MRRNWKVIWGTILLLAVLTFLMWIFGPSRFILVYSPPLCNVRVEKAIETFIQRELHVSWNNFFTPVVAEVMAVNDMQCEDNYGQANFAIILEKDSKVLFGMFRISFSREGNLNYSITIVPWKQYPDKNDPRIDAEWKNFTKFMQSVYPEEKKKPD